MPMAIKTQYLGYTNCRSSRVKATVCEVTTEEHRTRSVTLEWDCALHSIDNHRLAAKTLADRLEWAGDWHYGDAGAFYIWIRIAKDFTNGFVIEEKR